MRSHKLNSVKILSLLFLLIFSSGYIASAYGQDEARKATSAVESTDLPKTAPASLPSDAAEPALQTEGDEPRGPSTSPITLDFKDADINTVLRVLSLKSRVNIVAGPEVQGTVTIRLESVPWEKALEVVLRTYDYVYERDGNIVRVTTREKMAQETVVTNTYILNYTRAVEVQDAVKEMLTERGRIRIAERTNTLIITDIPTNLYRIAEVIKKLDQRTPQAFIDSKIIKTEVGVSESLGIAWTPAMEITGSSRPTMFPFVRGVNDDDEDISPAIEQFFPTIGGSTVTANGTNPRQFVNPIAAATGGAPFTFGTLNFSTFSAALSALKERSNTKVVSNPRIVVLNNQTAKVQVGFDIPLPAFERNQNTGSVEITGFTFRNIGVILNVTPHINSEEEILVELSPEISTQSGQFNFGEFNAPSFAITTAKTQVLIRSGETIAIGGLMTDSSGYSNQAVPGLSEIPIIGKFFRNKTQASGDTNKKTETLFFVTVTMVDTEGQPVGRRIENRIKKKFGSSKEDRLIANDALPEEAQIAAGTSPSEVPASTVNSLETKKVAAVPNPAPTPVH